MGPLKIVAKHETDKSLDQQAFCPVCHLGSTLAQSELGGPELGKLAVTIVRFVNDCQPGIVACEFVDAADRRHTLIDKIPIFSVDASLGADSKYPQPGVVRCTILKHWSDARGRKLVTISTA